MVMEIIKVIRKE